MTAEMLAPAPSGSVVHGLWISWQDHRRTQELASALGVPLLVMTGGKGLGRYVKAALGTIRAIASKRPAVLIVQNPSMVLSVLAAALKPFFGFNLVVDRHTYYFPRGDAHLSIKRRVAYWLSGITIRASDLTIVTNEGLAVMVRQAGGVSFVLPDRIPRFSSGVHAAASDTLGDPVEVVFVSTYASDEPLDEVITAARQLGVRFRVSITGLPRGRYAEQSFADSLPSNIRLTGFLSEPDYALTLAQADLVLVLTTLEDCLTCGAYEAVALGKVMVLSETRAIRNYFSDGAVYASPDAASIANALESAVHDYKRLRQGTRQLGQSLEVTWQMQLSDLSLRLANVEANGDGRQARSNEGRA